MRAGSASYSGFDVEPDFDAPDRTIACISQAGLGLPDRDDYFDASPRSIARRRAYLAHIAAMLELAGRDELLTLADDVLAFETGLAGGSISRREACARHRPRVFCADRHR